MNTPLETFTIDKYTVEIHYDSDLPENMYGYIVKDEHGKEIDSCWGLDGLDFARAEALADARFSHTNV